MLAQVKLPPYLGEAKETCQTCNGKGKTCEKCGTTCPDYNGVGHVVVRYVYKEQPYVPYKWEWPLYPYTIISSDSAGTHHGWTSGKASGRAIMTFTDSPEPQYFTPFESSGKVMA